MGRRRPGRPGGLHPTRKRRWSRAAPAGLHDSGYQIAGIFFGLWLLPLGYLAHKSGLFPPLLSKLLVVAGGAWIAGTLAALAWPDLPGAVHTILTAPTVAEFWMIAYLVTKGVRRPQADQLAPAAA